MDRDNQSVFSVIDSYLEGVELEKQASVKQAADPASALNTPSQSEAGLEPQTEGAHFNEKSKDILTANGGGISDKDKSEVANSENSSGGTLGTIGSDDAPQLKPKAQPDDKAVFAEPVSKASSLSDLGAQILAGINNEAPVKEAAAPVAVEATLQEKIASTKAAAERDAIEYADFLTGYIEGREKQAMEGLPMEGAPMEPTAGVTPEEATAELAASAGGAGIGGGALGAVMENGAGEGAGALDPEDLALLNQLEQQGISIDDIVALVEQAEAGGVDLGAEAPEALPEAAPAMEEPVLEEALMAEKGAALLKSAAQKLLPASQPEVAPSAEKLASQMKQEEVDVAVAAAVKIQKAAKYLNIAPADLFTSMFSGKGAK